MFCPNCESLMFPSQGKFICRQCGFKREINSNDTIKVTQKQKAKEMKIIDENVDAFPKAKVACPNCSNNEAYWHLRQMRGADEPETRFYRCTKCNHTWREN